MMPRILRALYGMRLPLIMVVALLTTSTTLAYAHDEGVLRLAGRTLIAGDSVAVRGEKFTKSATLRLTLVGLGGRFVLREVRTDTTGGFGSQLLIPEGIAAGMYRLVGVASDGDEVASLEVTVVVRAAELGHPADHSMGAMAGASATPLVLERARSPFLTYSVLVVIALTALTGLTLLRSDRRTRPVHPGSDGRR